jgi:hypothetical protein
MLLEIVVAAVFRGFLPAAVDRFTKFSFHPLADDRDKPRPYSPHQVWATFSTTTGVSR